jgi:hypothetical protein
MNRSLAALSIAAGVSLSVASIQTGAPRTADGKIIVDRGNFVVAETDHYFAKHSKEHAVNTTRHSRAYRRPGEEQRSDRTAGVTREEALRNAG